MEEINHDSIDLLINQYRHFKEIPSRELFQYTHSSTLKGIVDSGSIWATEHRYLNDLTELKHGMKMFTDQLEGYLLANGMQNSLGRFIQFLRIENENPKFKCFLSSFTEEGDLLSQWRGYGDFGKGLSIGFNAPKIPIDEQSHTSFWCKVEYDDAIKSQKVNEIMHDFIQAWNTIINLNQQESVKQIRNLILAFIQIAVVHSIKFKDKAWKEEKEWRHVTLSFPSHSPPIKIRNRESDLIEFIEIPMDKSYISSACVGPRSRFFNQENAIKIIMGHNFSIHKSLIPWV